MPRDTAKGKLKPPARTVALSQPAVGDAEWQALREPLQSGWLTQGPKVAEFEEAFASRHGVAHGVATTSGTTALHLALAALGIGPGDEVIVPAFTWVATANAVLYLGATPVLVDVDPHTYNIDVDGVRAAVTKHTRALVAVHLFGLCADIAALRDAVPERVIIVEDAACAAGADLRGKPAGSLGAVGCFSFHPRKSITTGEGGMVTTDDMRLAERMRSLRNHGAVAAAPGGPAAMPDIVDLGFNYRMTDLQAAIGLVQLEKLDHFIDERDRWARWYIDRLGDVDWLATPRVSNDCRHAWQAFVTVVDPSTAPMGRNALMERLASRGIATRPGTHAVSELSYYRDSVGIESTRYPVAAQLHRQSMAIPLHNRMSEADFEHVVDSLRDV